MTYLTLTYHIISIQTIQILFFQKLKDMDTIKRKIAAYKDEVERKEEGNGRNLTSFTLLNFIFF